ncbi:MAG: purine-nucleoside phosphorylase [Clostridia bacterium]|jgi:purine-nucleoside phosphorylase|nr:purine-nucleoside phosphorylase [Clostridia bacterium]MBR2613294.1 purine-nucleoside phosphorylase [Clostridia bacterium]
MLSYPTAHIKATPEQIAKTVLMPGDPKRSELVAKKFLKDAVMFNDVRGVKGYTGTWKGVPVSVMASGMGMPSIGIYSYELYHGFGVENIIRIGSAGSMREDVKVRDIVLGMGACTDSAYGNQFGLDGSFAPICDYELLAKSVEIGKEKGFRTHVGNILSSDVFYDDNPDRNLLWRKMGVLAVEMEAAALYMNAARAGKRALAICTVSNSLVTGEELSADERETTFGEMIELALDVAISFN